MINNFEGYYFKHQGRDGTAAFIAGRAGKREFVQVITADRAYYFNGRGNCLFTDKGAVIDLRSPRAEIKGAVLYGTLTPLKYDIMGLFKPIAPLMECRHGIISMRHTLSGGIWINGREFDFTDGLGYIECDSGRSFPKSYMWCQCNFPSDCSVSLAVADVPFAGTTFRGVICVVRLNGREYRIASYLGAKIVRFSPRRVVLRQGKYMLALDVTPRKGHWLAAPQHGKMSRFVRQYLECPVRLRLYEQGRTLFEGCSNAGSYEFV